MKAILTYHSIDTTGSIISTPPEDFARQLDQIEKTGVAVVPLGELLATPAPAIALTFDDGYVNFAESAWPRLRGRGWPATVFVVADMLGKLNTWERGRAAGLPLLGADALRDLAAEGVEVGCHGARHVRLRGIAADVFRRETLLARRSLEEALGTSVRSFAYPFGARHGSLDDSLHSTFTHIVTTRFDLVASDTSPWDLPRLDAFYFRGCDRLSGLLRPGFARWVHRRRALRKLGRRLRRWRKV